MKKKVFMFLTPFARLIKSNLDMRLWWEEQENGYPVLLYGVDVTNLNPNIQDDSFVEFADENLERELFHAAIEGAKVLITKKGGQERDYISGKDIIEYFIIDCILNFFFKVFKYFFVVICGCFNVFIFNFRYYIIPCVFFIYIISEF